MTPPLSRREFLASSAAAASAVALSTGSIAGAVAAEPRAGLPKSSTDLVTLGKSGIQVPLVGIGTGSHGSYQSSNQTKLGVKGFTRLIRHCLDRGVTFFDVADQYGSHTYLREALKGVPRDRYVIQTKTHATNLPDAKSHLERYRMELGVDMIDIVLLHCMTKKAWPADHAGAMDYLRQAKAEGMIRAHGTSCHGMEPLDTSTADPFVEISLARINPEGLVMDDKKPDEVASRLEDMHARGVGVIGMKVMGEGAFKEPERRDNSLRYVLGLGTVDSFVIGFETPEQVDDVLKRTDEALKVVAKTRGA